MADKPDMTDDWMNPPKREISSFSTTLKYPRFLIERQRRLDYYPFTKWDVWRCFDTAEERNQEFARLRYAHPAWSLRKREEFHPPIAYL